MIVNPGETLRLPLTITVGGEHTDADALPTAELWTGDTLVSASVTVVSLAGTGEYELRPTIPVNALAERFRVRVEAEVGGATLVRWLDAGAVRPGVDVIRTGICPRTSSTANLVIEHTPGLPSNFYTGLWVRLTGGTGAGQVRYVSGTITGNYPLDGVLRTWLTTHPNWVTVPDATTTYAILSAAGIHSVSQPVELTVSTLNSIASTVWALLTSSIVTVGSIGKLLVDTLNATIGSRAAPGDVMTLGGEQAGQLSSVESRSRLIDADVTIDKSVSPWQMVWTDKDTGTELLRKDLFDRNGDPIESVNQRIGSLLSP